MITEDDVARLATLARIALPREECGRLTRDIAAILGYVGEIQSVVFDGAAGLSDDILRNVMRDDGDPHEGGLFSDELLRAAPRTENGYVKVRKIL